MPVAKFHVSMRADLVTEVDAHGPDRSSAISESLSRYLEMLRRERATLRPMFSEAECSLILDACNGILMDSVSVQLLWAEVADAIQMDGLDQKWQVDGPALIAKLQALDYAASCTLIDAVERWWRRVGKGEELARGDLLA